MKKGIQDQMKISDQITHMTSIITGIEINNNLDPNMEITITGTDQI